MTIFVALALAVLAFVFVVYPFFRQRPRLAASAGDEELQELQSKRDTTYSMLKELEFDFQSGILTEEDFQDLESRYKGKAISILKNMDSLAASSAVEDEVERRVLALRRKKGPGGAAVGDEIEKEVLSLRQQKGQFCPQCGARHREGDRFCTQCGTKLNQGGTI